MNSTPCRRCGDSVKPRTDRIPLFCSIACSNKARQKRKCKSCPSCGEEFLPPRSHANQAFCSTACRDRAQVKSEEVPCSTCRKPVIRKANRIRRLKHSYCSAECRLIGIGGPNNPGWMGGHSTYRGPNWNRQRQKALRRDGRRCLHCDNIFELHVHHIKPFRSFSSYLDANEIDNLITLCDSCHAKEEYRSGSRAKASCS